MNEQDSLKIKNYILSLLARREYTEHEILNKCEQKNYDKNISLQVLNQIQEKGWQSDQRFIDEIINSYKGKKGINWIRQKLLSKGLKAKDFDEYIKNFDLKPRPSFYTETITKYKLDKIEIDFKTKAKVLNYIKSKGYVNTYEIYNELERLVDKGNNKNYT